MEIIKGFLDNGIIAGIVCLLAFFGLGALTYFFLDKGVPFFKKTGKFAVILVQEIGVSTSSHRISITITSIIILMCLGMYMGAKNDGALSARTIVVEKRKTKYSKYQKSAHVQNQHNQDDESFYLEDEPLVFEYANDTELMERAQEITGVISEKIKSATSIDDLYLLPFEESVWGSDFIKSASGQTICAHDRIMNDLIALAIKVKEATGTPLVLSSSYRTLETQKSLYEAYKSGKGPKALEPYKSNHNYGLAIDVDFDASKISIGKFRKIAESFNFFPISEENWHFDHKLESSVKKSIELGDEFEKQYNAIQDALKGR